MNAKKAIEFIEGHKVDYNDEIGYQGKIIRCKDDNITKMYDDIIDLFQQGEKYRLMWKSIETAKINDKVIQRAIKILIKDIKEKYQNKS